LGCAQNSWRAAQVGNQDLRTNSFQPSVSSGFQAAIPDVADVLEKSYDERGFHKFLTVLIATFLIFLRTSWRIVQRCCGGQGIKNPSIFNKLSHDISRLK
jgi:hypothetical protein